MGGQQIAMSLVEPFLPLPVLSPIRHVLGRPARKECKPVVFPIIHSVSCRREAAESGFSSINNFFKSSSIADGLVVSRSSPATAVLSNGSLRSKRVTESP
jgi:hypothetical protein